MPGHHMPAQPRGEPHCSFQIDRITGLENTEGGHFQRLRREIDPKPVSFTADYGHTCPAQCDTYTDGQAIHDVFREDSEPGPLQAFHQRLNDAQLLDNPREHMDSGSDH